MRPSKTRHARSLAGLFALLIAAATLCGCFSRLTGNAGEFTFGYQTDVQIENFNKPLAPGSRLELVAFEEADGDEQLKVVSASSSDPSVLTVVTTNRLHATIEALEPGHARVTMTVEKADGTTVEDSVYMNVAEPVALELAHTCTDGDRAAYVAADNVILPFQMSAEDGRAVIGEGYQPVRVEPEGALRFLAKPKGRSAMIFLAGPPADEVRVRSKVDDTSLSLRLVQRSDIDAILEGAFAAQARTVVGEKAVVDFLPMAGSDPVCQSGALTKAKSLTPDICTVTADLDGDGSNWNRHQLAVIEGRKFGVCEYEVVFPEAGDGEGVRASYRLPVGMFPGDDQDALAEQAPNEERREPVPWYLAPLMALIAPALAAPFLWWVWRR